MSYNQLSLLFSILAPDATIGQEGLPFPSSESGRYPADHCGHGAGAAGDTDRESSAAGSVPEPATGEPLEVESGAGTKPDAH